MGRVQFAFAICSPVRSPVRHSFCRPPALRPASSTRSRCTFKPSGRITRQTTFPPSTGSARWRSSPCRENVVRHRLRKRYSPPSICAPPPRRYCGVLPMTGLGRPLSVTRPMLRTRRRPVLLLSLLLAFFTVCLPAQAAPRAHSSVVGGQPASLSQWGFTVAVLDPRGPNCSGSVISPTKILTAAHCVEPGMVIRTGSTSAFFGGETRNVVAATNPGYDGRLNDLAVLTLDAPTSAPPIQLASPTDDAIYAPPGNHLAAAGFGCRNPLSYQKCKAGALMATAVISTTTGPCRALKGPNELCTTGSRIYEVFSGRKRRSVLRGQCFGDSGGPVVAQTPAGPRLLAVTDAVLSLGSGPFSVVLCNLKNFPAIDARVAPYLGFIQSQL
jgi:Trypsin